MAVVPSNIPAGNGVPKVQTLQDALQTPALPDPWAARQQQTAAKPHGWKAAVGGLLNFAPIKYGVLKPLELLAVPKNAIVSGLAEFRDAVDGNPNTRASARDWWKQTTDPTYGFGTAFKPFGSNGNRWSLGFNRLAGFFGDVVLDPMMHLSTGAHLADRAALEVSDFAGRELLARKAYTEFMLAGENVAEAGAKAQQILKDGIGAARELLTPAQRASVGVTDAGLYMFKGKYVPSIRIPLSGPLGDVATGASARVREMFTSTAVGKWFQEATMAGDKTIAEARLALLRGEVPNEKVGLRLFSIGAMEPRRASASAAQLFAQDALAALEKQTGIAGDDALASGLARIMENPDLYASASEQMRNTADAIRTFFNETHSQMGNAMRAVDPASPITFLDNYFPHQLTPEARDFLFANEDRWAQTLEALGVKELNPADMLHPRRLTEGSVFFDETLTKADLNIERLNEIARSAGLEGNFFEADVRKVLDRYTRQWIDQMGSAGAFKYLSDNGVLDLFLSEWRTSPEAMARALRDRSKAEAKHIASLAAFGEASDKVGKAVNDLRDALAVDAGKADAALLAATQEQNINVEKAAEALRKEVASYDKLVEELDKATTELFNGIEQGTLADLFRESLTDSVGKVKSVRDDLAALVEGSTDVTKSFEEQIALLEGNVIPELKAARDAAVSDVQRAKLAVTWLEKGWDKIVAGEVFNPKAEAEFKQMLNKIAESGIRERAGGKGGQFGFADAYNVYNADEFRKTVLPDLYDRAHGLGKWAGIPEAERLRPTSVNGINEADFIREITGGAFPVTRLKSLSFERAAELFDKAIDTGSTALAHDSAVVMLANQLQFYGTFDNMPPAVREAVIDMSVPVARLAKMRSFERMVANAGNGLIRDAERAIARISSLDESLGAMVWQVTDLHNEARFIENSLDAVMERGEVGAIELENLVEEHRRVMDKIEILNNTIFDFSGKEVSVDEAVKYAVLTMSAADELAAVDNQLYGMIPLGWSDFTNPLKLPQPLPPPNGDWMSLRTAKAALADPMAEAQGKLDSLIARDAMEFAKNARTEVYTKVELGGSVDSGTRTMRGYASIKGATAEDERRRLLVQFELAANEARVARAYEAVSTAFSKGGIMPNGDKLFNFLWEKQMAERAAVWRNAVSTSNIRAARTESLIKSLEEGLYGKKVASAADYADAAAALRSGLSKDGARSEYVLADKYFTTRRQTAALERSATSSTAAINKAKADAAEAYKQAKAWFKERNPSVARPTRRQVEQALNPFASGVNDAKSWQKFVKGIRNAQSSETSAARTASNLVGRQQTERQAAARLRALEHHIAALNAELKVLDEFAKVAPDAALAARQAGVVASGEAAIGAAAPIEAAMRQARAQEARANEHLDALMASWMYHSATQDQTKLKLLNHLSGFEGHKLTATDWRGLGFFPAESWDPQFMKARAEFFKEASAGGDVYRWDPIKNQHVPVASANDLKPGEKVFRRVDSSVWEPMSESKNYRDAISEIEKTQRQIEELRSTLLQFADESKTMIGYKKADGSVMSAITMPNIWERIRYWNDYSEQQREWLIEHADKVKRGIITKQEADALKPLVKEKQSLIEKADQMVKTIWNSKVSVDGEDTKILARNWQAWLNTELNGALSGTADLGMARNLEALKARLSEQLMPPPSAFELSPEWKKMQSYLDGVNRGLETAQADLEDAVFAASARDKNVKKVYERYKAANAREWDIRSALRYDSKGNLKQFKGMSIDELRGTFGPPVPLQADPLEELRLVLGGGKREISRESVDALLSQAEADVRVAQQELEDVLASQSGEKGKQLQLFAIQAKVNYEQALADRRSGWYSFVQQRQAELGDSRRLTAEGAKMYRGTGETVYRDGLALGGWEKLKQTTDFTEIGLAPIGNDVGTTFTKEEWDALFISPFDPPKKTDTIVAMREAARKDAQDAMRRLTDLGIAESKGQISADEVALVRAQTNIQRKRLERARKLVAATDPKVWSSAQRKLNSIVSKMDPNLLESKAWFDLISMNPNPDHVVEGVLAQTRKSGLEQAWSSSVSGGYMSRVDDAAQKAAQAQVETATRAETAATVRRHLDELIAKRALMQEQEKNSFLKAADETLKAQGAMLSSRKYLPKVVGRIEENRSSALADLAKTSSDVAAMNSELAAAKKVPVATVKPEVLAAGTRTEQRLAEEQARLTALQADKKAVDAAMAAAQKEWQTKIDALQKELDVTLKPADAMVAKADKRISDLIFARYRVNKKIAAQEAVVAQAQQAFDAAKAISPDEIAAMHRVTVAEANVNLIDDLMANMKAVGGAGNNVQQVGARSQFYKGRQVIVDEGGKPRAYDIKKALKIVNDGEDAKASLARGWEESTTRKGGDQVVVKKYLTEKRRRDLEALVERGTVFSERLAQATMSDVEAGRLGELGRDIVSWMDSGKQFVADAKTGKMLPVDGLAGVVPKEEKALRAVVQQWQNAETAMLTSGEAFNAADELIANPQLLQQELVPMLKEGFQTLESWGLPSYATDPWVKEFFDNFQRMEDPAVAKALGDFLGWYTKRFKAYAVASPGFHVRNALDNTFRVFSAGAGVNNMLEGMTMFERWVSARKGADLEGFLAGLGQKRDVFERALNIYHGSGSGQGGSALSELLGSVKLKKIDENFWLRANRNLTERIEGSARFMLAYDSAVKGMDAEQGMLRVRRFLFDYSAEGRNNLDRSMRHIVPFWTYMSKNLPFQIVNRWKNPKAYIVLNDLFKNISGGDGSGIPSYLMEGGAVDLGGGNVLNADFGQNRIAEQLNMLKDPVRLLKDVNPGLRLPLELVGSRRFYNNKEFSKQPQEIPGGPLQPAVAALLGMLGLTETAGAARTPNSPAPGSEVTSSKAAYALMNSLPPLAMLERLVPSTSQYQENQGNSWLGWLGVPYRHISEEQQRANREQAQAELLRSLKAQAGK